MIYNIYDLFKRVKFLRNYLEKSVGLMFKIKIPEDVAYIFCLEDNDSKYFHTFFCFKKINFIMLDKNKKVLKVLDNVKPFRIIKLNNNVKYVIEYVGKSKNIKVGDIIKW